MRRHLWICSLSATLATGVGAWALCSDSAPAATQAAEGADAGVRVSVQSVNESRTNKAPERFDRGGPSPDSSLDVELGLDGPSAKAAERMAALVVDEAVDDTGRDLLPTETEDLELWRMKRELNGKLRRAPKDDGGLAPPKAIDGAAEDDAGDRPKPQRVPVRGRFSPADKRDKPNLTLQLMPTARQAKVLSRLRGHFELRWGGERTTATFDRAASRYGKQLDDPVLAAAGVTAKLSKPPRFDFPDGRTMVSVDISAGADLVTRLRVLAADGTVLGEQVVTDGVARRRGGGSAWVTIRQPLDDTMKLEVQVVAGQKSVEVPFDLKDVPLP